MKLALVIVAALLLTPSSGQAQLTDRRTGPPSVTASGEAVITVEPDQAEIDIGVVTQAKNAPDAARENADKLARVLAQIKKNLGKGDEVKTASYSLTPNYRYPQGGKPELIGYTATNILRVRTGTLANVGKLIDGAMQSGANTIYRLLFNLKDEQSAQLQALRLASAKAKTKAEAMADALGLRVVGILSVAEGDRGVRPIVMRERAAQMEAMAAAPTPVEPGTIEVRSSVTLTAELGPR
ncbi:MAG: SIMPL domain-containing protein [Alphaproteobacteria bacterium]